jgi:shikimate dehydrogenase
VSTAIEQPVAPQRAAVLGSPIAHSLSPVLHRAAYAELGLHWQYDAIDCDEAALAGFLAAADEFAGLSLTMPLKRAVLPLLDEVSPLAAAVGAVNTVTFATAAGGGRRTRRGDNTDVAGIVGAIRAARPDALGPTTILGAGGTAAAAVAACRELESSAVRVVVRDRGRAEELLTAAANLGVDVEVLDWPALDALRDADLVMSTVPAGAADQLVAEISRIPFTAGQLVFDVLYHPWPTALAGAARNGGAEVIGGLELLVRQAGIQVRLMTGCPAPIDVMRAAGAAALAARH